MATLDSIARIYVLVDPLTSEIRYVGWTTKPLHRRLRHHLTEAKKSNNHKSTWVRSLVRRGYVPDIRLVQEVPLTVWKEAEVYWIAKFKSLGCPLVNATSGGEGTPGHVVSDSVREQNSQLHKGKVISESHREAISQSAKKRWERWRTDGSSASEETREKIRAARTGKKASEETKKAMSLSASGRSLSDEHREKIRQSLLGKAKTPEHRAKCLTQYMGK